MHYSFQHKVPWSSLVVLIFREFLYQVLGVSYFLLNIFLTNTA